MVQRDVGGTRNQAEVFASSVHITLRGAATRAVHGRRVGEVAHKTCIGGNRYTKDISGR